MLPLLPQNIEIPTIEKLDPDASPIMTVSISSNHSVREMTDYCDKVLRRQIESVNGVGQVQIIGGRKRQININLDGDKLRAYNLTVAQVSMALQAQNLEVPGGRIEQEKQTLTLRTLGRLQNPKEFNNIVVSTRNGYPIKISDIGEMEDGIEQEVSAGFYNDKPTLLLQIRRQSGTNTVDVIDGLKEELEGVKKSMPPGYELNIVRDQAVFILAAFHTVREHLVVRFASGGAGRAAVYAKSAGDDHCCRSNSLFDYCHFFHDGTSSGITLKRTINVGLNPGRRNCD